MKTLPVFSGILLSVGFLLASCSPKSRPVTEIPDTNQPQDTMALMAQPPCIIYKTKADYAHLVPVMLSADRKSITSYPDVSDIRKQGEGVFPGQLAEGFLLDNRGIGPQVAFLDITYQEFAGMTVTPDAATLFSRILDDDPLVEMYQCGSRYGQPEMTEALNRIILSGKWVECKKLK